MELHFLSLHQKDEQEYPSAAAVLILGFCASCSLPVNESNESRTQADGEIFCSEECQTRILSSSPSNTYSHHW